jgi:TetR/AcrR family transcriptional regulator, transcriptional repressor for nem operon
MDTQPSKKELTHARILDAAARAIRRSGFEGVGVADVMKEAGLTHGGFYAHFDSREAMLAEALTRAGSGGAASLARRVEGRKAGATTFRGIVEGYLSEAHLAGTESGCPVAALASEMPRQSPELREASVKRVQSLVEKVRDALPGPGAKEEAMVIASTMVGALQLARVLGTNAKGRSMLAAARESLLATYDRN